MGILYKLFSTFFKKDIEDEYKDVKEKSFNDGVIEGRRSFYEEDKVERVKILNFEAQRIASSGPVIVLSNEWQNPVIGKVTSFTTSHWDKEKNIPVVKDYLTGEVFEEYRTLIPFSMKTLEALGKLNPDDVVSLFYEGKNSNRDVYKKRESVSSDEGKKYTGIDDWLHRMEKANFFIDYPEFKDTNLYKDFSRKNNVYIGADIVNKEVKFPVHKMM